MGRFKIGSEVVFGSVLSRKCCVVQVVAHGRDTFGIYTEIHLSQEAQMAYPKGAFDGDASRSDFNRTGNLRVHRSCLRVKPKNYTGPSSWDMSPEEYAARMKG